MGLSAQPAQRKKTDAERPPNYTGDTLVEEDGTSRREACTKALLEVLDIEATGDGRDGLAAIMAAMMGGDFQSYACRDAAFHAGLSLTLR